MWEKKWLWVIMLLGVVIGLSVLVMTKMQNTNRLPGFGSNMSNSPTDGNKKSQVEVIPVNADKFSKRIVTEDECNNPIGLVSYEDMEKKMAMKINYLSNTSSGQAGLNLIKDYVEGKRTVSSWENLGDWNLPFHDYCGGATFLIIREVAGISYPGSDAVKAQVVYTSQGMFGQATVVVWAKKGEDMIQLSKYLDDETLYQNLKSECNLGQEMDKNEQCYREKISQDSNLYEESVRQAKELVNTFAIIN